MIGVELLKPSFDNYKITIFLASLRGGGAERTMVNLANALLNRGFQIDLVLVTKEGPYFSELHPGVRVIDLEQKRVLNAIWPLVKYMRLERPDILISTMNYVNVVALISRCLARVSTKVVVREVTMVSLANSYTTGYRSRLVQILIGYIYPLADLIITVSHGVAEDLISSFKLSPDIIRVVYDPVVIDNIQNQAMEAVLHPWFDNKQIPIILAAGRLNKEKDYPTLLRAFALLSKRTPARLVIIGEGDERQNLEELSKRLGIEDNISMPGFVENPFSYMRNASAFVLSSTVEGLSNVLIQAMSVGTPVVSTNCPCGPAEVLDNGKYGPLVPVGDVDALAEAIYTVLHNPPEAEYLQAGTVRFNADKICMEYVSAISEVLKGRTRVINK